MTSNRIYRANLVLKFGLESKNTTNIGYNEIVYNEKPVITRFSSSHGFR